MTVRDWLKEQIAKYPALAGTFPTLIERLDAAGADDLNTPWGIARFLFWMVDAARRATHPCPDRCPPDNGAVPLARVWTERVGNLYLIRFVDATPPYRRPLGGGPVSDTGEVVWDHRTYIGRRWDDVARSLSRLGVVAEREDLEFPADGHSLLNLLQDENEGEGPLLAPNLNVIAVVARRIHPGSKTSTDGLSSPEPFAERVVAFRRPSVMGARPPMTTLGETSYQARLYRGDPASPVSPPVIGTAPGRRETQRCHRSAPRGVREDRHIGRSR